MRIYAQITQLELSEKIQKLYRNWQYDPNSDDIQIRILHKDLKVSFSFENLDGGPNFDTSDDHHSALDPRGLLGLRTLGSGFTFCGYRAGGDWQCPVFFIIYWDGRHLRAYVPSRGNVWNRKTREAWDYEEFSNLKLNANVVRCFNSDSIRDDLLNHFISRPLRCCH